MALSPVEPLETSFVDRRGARRRAFRWPARRPFMGLLILHTFGAHAGRYDRPAGEFALTGITVEAFDLPGHGTSGEERGALGDWAAILDDVADRLGAFRSELPDLPVAIYGHGLGGLIAADYQRSGRPAADALVLVAPALAVPARRPSLRESIARRFRSPNRIGSRSNRRSWPRTPTWPSRGGPTSSPCGRTRHPRWRRSATLRFASARRSTGSRARSRWSPATTTRSRRSTIACGT